MKIQVVMSDATYFCALKSKRQSYLVIQVKETGYLTLPTVYEVKVLKMTTNISPLQEQQTQKQHSFLG